MRRIPAVLAAGALIGCSMTAAYGTSTGTAVAQRQPVQGCSPSTPSRSGPTDGLVSVSNGLGSRLLNTLVAGQGNGNTFISPISIELALGMAYNGSAGASSSAMASALGFTHMNRAQVRAQAAALLSKLVSGDPKVRLEVANSLWARNGFPFRKSFVNQTRQSFAARVANLDFASPSAPQTINAWVSCATHGTIKQVVTRIPPDMVMYLINTVYFKGEWSSPFLSAQTSNQTFNAAGGTSESVPMMHQAGHFPYVKAQDYQAISLKYGNGRFSMTVVLPDAGTSLSKLGSQLTPSVWQQLRSGMTTQFGNIALPRFTIRNTFNLNHPLTALGMGQAFSRQANFSNLCKRPCRISEVLHKTYLRVYEKGTEASAVTSVGVGATAAETPHYTMVVDRPFYLSIADSQTGATLFLGAINNAQG